MTANKCNRYPFTLAVLISAITFGASQTWALNVATTSDPNLLTSAIVGSGITVVGTPTYTGASLAAGTFSGGTASGITIESGILLTSGQASLAVGPNSSDEAGLKNGEMGDADLDALAGDKTFDAIILEFDFTTLGGNLFFNYAFGSEEYSESVGLGFNDVFAFFLDGNNIALLPDTTPVSINNVNLGINSALYNNNDLVSGAPHNIEYDGFTDVLTASMLGLTPGLHHAKIAIADARDATLDSGVFIQANSFSDQRTPVPDVGSTFALMGLACLSLGITRKMLDRS